MVDLNGEAAPAAKVYEKTGLTPDVDLISVEPKEGWNNPDKNVIDLQKFEVNQAAIETVPTRVWSVEADPASITVGGTSTLKTRLNFQRRRHGCQLCALSGRKSRPLTATP